MKLFEMAADKQLTPVIAKRATKVVNAIKKAVKNYGKNTVTLNVLTETSARIDIDFHQWMRAESITDIYDELSYLIKKTDVEGYINSLEEVGHGAEFVEALLSGLKPGMSLRAEAFFPTISFEIKWKNIIKK